MMMEEGGDHGGQESHTTMKEINQLSLVSIHFDKEEVKFLYYNMNCNYLKCNELLSNVPNEKIKKCIEDLESKQISRSQFASTLSKILEEKFKEEERLKKKALISIEPASWKITRSSSSSLGRLNGIPIQLVCQYLDIYSLYALGLTEKYFYKLEKLSVIYKPIAAAVFKPVPQSTDSIYAKMVNMVRAIPETNFGAGRKTSIIEDVRRHVWRKDPASIKTSKKYLSEYANNFRDMFFKLPQLRFDGYYCCNETYFRKGMADLTGFYVPIHYVQSYRYLRFYDDGHVLYCISTKKFNRDTALKMMSKDFFEKNLLRRESQAMMMFGEFVVANVMVHIKMPDKAWINEMDHLMKVGDGFGDNHLQIVSHVMRDLETDILHQMERDMKQKERLYYFNVMGEFTKEMTNPVLKAIFTFRSEDKEASMIE